MILPMARLVTFLVTDVRSLKLIMLPRLSSQSLRSIPMIRELVSCQSLRLRSDLLPKSPMAEMEENDDSHNLLAILFPWELSTPRTFCLHRDFCSGLPNHTNKGFWSYFVSEHPVWRWNNDYSPLVPQIRPETGHAGFTTYLSCWVDWR